MPGTRGISHQSLLKMLTLPKNRCVASGTEMAPEKSHRN